MHTRKEDAHSSLREEECSKKAVKSFIQVSSSGSLSSFSQLSGFFFYT